MTKNQVVHYVANINLDLGYRVCYLVCINLTILPIWSIDRSAGWKKKTNVQVSLFVTFSGINT